MSSNVPFGLDEETTELIERYLKVFPDIDEAIIFGSRAMGNYRPASDIDIALKGQLKEDTVSALKSMLSNAPRFPYQVDILDYDNLSNQELKKHIDDYGKVFFKLK